MTQSLLLVALFVALMACLPWAIKRLRLRTPAGVLAAGAAPRLVSTLAVGPQQRVVTVEVGPAGARVQLVLGVTGQSIRCLHTLPPDGAGPAAPGAPAAAPPAPASPFAALMRGSGGAPRAGGASDA
ncbi:MAG: flagellar biosynthetic protein FliO [Xylophilus ampelinus]